MFNGVKPSRLIWEAISCFARPKARYIVFDFPQARAYPPALAAPIGFRRHRLHPRVVGASGKSPRTKLGSGTGERAAGNVPSRRHERGEKQQHRPEGAGGGRRSRGLPAAPPRHPPLPEAPGPAPPSAPGSAGSQGSAPGRARSRPGSFSALHATRSPSVPFPPVPRTPRCESAGRCGEDGDGPVSRQGRPKHSGDVPEAGTWVSPRPAAPARMNAPDHGLSCARGPVRGYGRAKPAAAARSPWAAAADLRARPWQSKVRAGRAATVHETAWGRALSHGHGCRHTGSGEGSRASGHHLPGSSPGTWQVPAEPRTGEAIVKRSACGTPSREDASNSRIAVFQKCRHLQTRDFICACF